MQITKEKIDNPEMRSRLTASKYKTIFLVCLISFTSLLVGQTLQVQHSCNPMIHWSGELPVKCQSAGKISFNNFDEFSYFTKEKLQIPKQKNKITLSESTTNADDFRVEKASNISQATELQIADEIPQPKPEDRSNSVDRFVNEHSNDIVGAVAGVAGGVATVAAASATAAFSIPVAGAVLIGLGIWYAIRTIL